MHKVRMVAVDRVLDLQLPVARVAVLVDAGAHVELALGRQIDEQIDLIPGLAQMFVERDSFGREAAEYKSAIGSHPGQVGKAELFLTQRPTVAVLIGNGAELTVVSISPAMIRAAEKLCVPLRGLTYGSGPMAASIQQRSHLAIVIAHHDHWSAPDLSQPVVTRIRNLAGVPQVDPSSMEDPGDLVLEDIGIEIDPAVNPVVTYQRVVVDGHAGLRAHAIPPGDCSDNPLHTRY